MSYFNYKSKKIFYQDQGSGQAIMLLHGNTASSKLFEPVLPIFAKEHRVITLDFLGCGQSDRLKMWPADLWYEWANQVVALCSELKLESVTLIGTSGGALVALNAALMRPDLFKQIVADSFEGLEANSSITEQLCMGREAAKHNDMFRQMLSTMHGEDWEGVFDSDTKAVVEHARTVGKFVHGNIEDLKVRTLLTGSSEDEMFPKGHYEKLFEGICNKNANVKAHVFEHGSHPAMFSNIQGFVDLVLGN